LEPLDLTEHEQVTLEVTDRNDILDQAAMARARKEVAEMTHIPTLEELHQLLSKDLGSWSDTVIEARKDR